ncbi:glycosyltransferase family 25 protein [Amphritea sp. HPY]|uniref:glycosyltransferase family 25 protein n=1 Tax=Amphritea sp. HPY TaxID=3421652 RepID=UPI003D7EDC38
MSNPNLNISPQLRKNSVIIQVLTCSKSPKARLVSAQQQLEKFLPDIPVSIVMGYVASDNEVHRIYSPSLNRRLMKRPLTEAEIAIYAGHRKAMAEFLKSPYEATLILEDDFKIVTPDIIKLSVELAPELLNGTRNIVKLFDFQPKKTCKEPIYRETVKGISLVKYKSPRAGMVAYLISREGAENFLARSSVFRMVDEDIKYFWELDLDIWSIPENPVTDNSDRLGGSLVDEERQYARRQKTICRSVYGNILTIHRKFKTFLENIKYCKSKSRTSQETGTN